MSELDPGIRRRHRAPATGTLAYILFGPILWGLQLFFIYAGHTLICAAGLQAGGGRIMVLAVTAVAALVLLAFLVGQRFAAGFFGLLEDTPGRRTYDSVSRTIGALAMIAIVWAGGAALVVASCVQAR